MVKPLLRAAEQLRDPALFGVVIQSLLLAAACFAGLVVACVWGLHALLASEGVWSWLAGLAGGVGAALLSLWLFLPLAAGIAVLFSTRIAAAVDARYYPFLAPPHGASLSEQTWDGIAFGLRVLAWNLVSLVLALVLPGIGLVLGWAIGAWAVGRGLFVTLAMRRMSRAEALRLYRRRRGPVWVQGLILTFAATVPVLNLLVPVFGTAAMEHLVVDPAMA